jgi:hypothetical protein
MRFFTVVEPRSVQHLGQECIEFVGTEVLAATTRSAASTYVEQRPHKWGKTICVWVIDKLLNPQVGPDTYTLRVGADGKVEFWA